MGIASKILTEETPKEFFKRRNMRGSPCPPGVRIVANRLGSIHLHAGHSNDYFATLFPSLTNMPNGTWKWYCYGEDNSTIDSGTCRDKDDAIRAACACYFSYIA